MRARGAESEQGLREKLMVIEAVSPGIWRSLKRLRKRPLREVWCWLKRRKARLEKLRRANQAAVSAEKLVALAAVSYAFPEAISYDSLEEFDFKMGFENLDDSELSVADAYYTTALRSHEASFPAQWPPSPSELEIFRKWANALRQN